MKVKQPFPGTLQDWKSLVSHCEYARGGMDRDVLDAFPAQRVIDPSPALVEKWQRLGGRIIGDQLCAIKSAAIWSQLSEFGLPYGPFETDSWSDLEDIGRDEAEQLGVISGGELVHPIEIPLPTDLFLPPNEPRPPRRNIGFRPGWQ